MRLTLGAWHARYMVVLRMGGVYMDGDVECRRPLDELILPGDTLVAGWEAEFPNASIARAKEYVRKRQVQALNIGSFLVKLYISLDEGLSSSCWMTPWRHPAGGHLPELCSATAKALRTHTR